MPDRLPSRERPDDLLRLPEVAKRLDISVTSVRRLIADKVIRATNVGVGSVPRWRVSVGEVTRFNKARTDR